MTASVQCPHTAFSFNVAVARFEDDAIKMAEVTGHCTLCGKHVRFRGVAMGCSFREPRVSIDGLSLTLPVVVDGEIVDEAKRRPGYDVSVR